MKKQVAKCYLLYKIIITHTKDTAYCFWIQVYPNSNSSKWWMGKSQTNFRMMFWERRVGNEIEGESKWELWLFL